MAHIITSKIEVEAVLHQIEASPTVTEWTLSLSNVLQTVMFNSPGMVIIEVTIQEYEQWISYRDRVTL